MQKCFSELWVQFLSESITFFRSLIINSDSERKKLTKNLTLLIMAILSVASLASADDSFPRKSLIVDVELGSTLSLRAKTDLSKVINSLSKNEPVMIVDNKVKRFNNMDYILVRKILFPVLRCIVDPFDDTIYSPHFFDRITTDTEFAEYKKQNSINSCPLIDKWDSDKDKNVKQRVVLTQPSLEKTSELEGYAALEHLKGFSIPNSFTKKHLEVLSTNGYRIIEPFDFFYYKSIDSDSKIKNTFVVFFNDGHYHLYKYDDYFNMRKLVDFNMNHYTLRALSYKPIYQVNNGFVMHLLKEIDKKTKSFFVFIDSKMKLHILSEMESEDGIDEYFYLIPNQHPLIYDKNLVELNLRPLPFFGMDFEAREKQGFEKHDMSDFLKSKELDYNSIKLKESFEDYQKSPQSIDFAIVIFDDFQFGDQGVNPSNKDTAMQKAEIVIKFKKSDEMFKSGLIPLFD